MAIDVPSVWLWLADDESWERFDARETGVIAKALDKGHKGAILERGSTHYYLDLIRLTQTNACTGRRRPIYNVKRGAANWMVQQQHQQCMTDTWQCFSKKETKQLEKAFFGGSDFVVLNRDDGTQCYVDLAKWTLTCLDSNISCYIKITPANGTTPAISYSIGREEEEQSHRRHKGSAFLHESGSERTSTTVCVEEEEESPSVSAHDSVDGAEEHQAQDTIIDQDKAVKAAAADSTTRRRKNRAAWKWHNDTDSWSTYEDDIVDAIEQSWATGANDMVVQQGQTQYYIDLQKLTQTNIDTGFTRPIQRVSQRKKSNSY